MKISRIRAMNMFLPLLLAAAGSFALRLHAQAQSGEKKNSPGTILMLNYTDAGKSPYYRSSRLAERFLAAARSTVNAGKRAWKIQVRVSPENEPRQFSVTPRALKREIRIVVPREFDFWRDDRKMHVSLMALMIQAQLGVDFKSGKQEKGKPEKRTPAEILQNHWIVRALARKALEDPLFRIHPFFRVFPGAWALSAAGFFPPVRDVMNPSPLPDYESPAALLESEYAELLFDACSAAGFFRGKQAETLLRLALTAPDEDPFEAFLKLASGALKKPVPAYSTGGWKRSAVSASPGPGPDFSAEDCDIWFRKRLSAMLLHYFTPAGVERFEELFRNASSCEFTDREGETRQCRVSEFPAFRGLFPDANAAADEFVTRLSLLSFTAPAGFQKPLSELRLALARCRTDTSPEAAAELQEKEKYIYTLISSRAELERILLLREWKYTPPVFRLRQTLQSARLTEERDSALPDAIRENLDRRDEYR